MMSPEDMRTAVGMNHIIFKSYNAMLTIICIVWLPKQLMAHFPSGEKNMVVTELVRMDMLPEGQYNPRQILQLLLQFPGSSAEERCGLGIHGNMSSCVRDFDVVKGISF